MQAAMSRFHHAVNCHPPAEQRGCLRACFKLTHGAEDSVRVPQPNVFDFTVMAEQEHAPSHYSLADRR